jgi:hypothetical protein
MALPGSGLTAILDRLTPAGAGEIRVSATSTLGTLPTLAAANLLRGRQASPWIAAFAGHILGGGAPPPGRSATRTVTIYSFPPQTGRSTRSMFVS